MSPLSSLIILLVAIAVVGLLVIELLARRRHHTFREEFEKDASDCFNEIEVNAKAQAQKIVDRALKTAAEVANAAKARSHK